MGGQLLLLRGLVRHEGRELLLLGRCILRSQRVAVRTPSQVLAGLLPCGQGLLQPRAGERPHSHFVLALASSVSLFYRRLLYIVLFSLSVTSSTST